MSRLTGIILAMATLVALALSPRSRAEDSPRAIIQDTVADATIFTIAPTGSMEPALNETMWVLVKPLPFKGLRAGDIIIWRPLRAWFKVPGTEEFLICHRVWTRSSEGTFVVTKGDHNPGPDSELIDESMYIGTVVAVVKRPR